MQWDIRYEYMELILLNYENKQTVISYDIQNNIYCRIFSNMKRKGFYDIWDNSLFGIIVLNHAVWVFVEANIFKLADICDIKNDRTGKKTSLFIETISGSEYKLVTTIDLISDYVLESDYYADGTEYNLGLYIEKLKKKKDSENLFIKNVITNGLIIT